MALTTTDRRTVRTKQLLRDAVLDVIEDLGFDSLTVRQVTERAGLNRGTFYSHYLDLHDLLKQYKEELFGVMKGISEQFEPKDFLHIQSVEAPPEHTIALFEFLAEHARFFRTLLGPKGDPAFPAQMKQFMLDNFYEKLARYQPIPDEMDIPPAYLAHYVISANLGLLQYWFESGTTMSPREMAKLSIRLSRFGPAQSSILSKMAFTSIV